MNVIAKAWLLCAIAQHYDDNKFMSDILETEYGPGEFMPLHGEYDDFMFFYNTHGVVYNGIRGTHGKGWLSNLNCKADNNGFHAGFVKGYGPFREKIHSIVKENEHKQFVVGAHSRGTAFATQMAYHERGELGKYIKPVLFCPPEFANEIGCSRLSERRIDQINMIARNDIVDNIGVEIIGGMHHGSTVLMPNKEFSFWQKMKDLIPNIGHALREVNDSLQVYFDRRGMQNEVKYLKSVRWVAKI